MDNTEIEKEIIQEKKSISRLRLFMLLFLLCVVAAFAYAYYSAVKQLTRQVEDASVFDVRLQNVENAIPLHEKRIVKLEEDTQKLAKISPSPAASAAPVTPEVNDRIAALEKEIKALKTPAIASRNSEQIAQEIALLSSLHHLSDKILSGKPFAAELSSFEESYGADVDKSLNDIISQLAPYADNGVPSMPALIAMFEDAANSAKKDDKASLPENASFWDKLLFNLSHMISIRRTDKNQSGNSVDAILARAEDDLENQETEAAIAEVRSLPDNIRSYFTFWMEDAQMQSIAPSLVEQLEEKVTKKTFSAPN